MAYKAGGRKRRGRRHDAKGRSIGEPRFVQLRHFLLDCPAWRSMGCAPRQLYVELRRRFNGSNNGEISYSVRQAASDLHIAKDTAMKAFRELEEKGFLKCAQSGSFHWKERHASLWILTEEDYRDQFATKEFMRWQPKSEAGPKRLRKRPNRRTNCGETDSS